MTSALLKQEIDREYLTATRGEGVFLYDSTGKRYLDGSSGAMTANIGHGVREVAEIVSRQAGCLAFSYRTQFTNEPAEELARRLTELAPGDLNWAFFVNSGSEGTEYAMRAAVGYWRELGHPGKVKILGRATSYHGMTMGALSMSGHTARRPDYGTLLHSFALGPTVDASRLAYSGEDEVAYGERAAAEFEQTIIEEDPSTIAAVIVEPIVGAAGGVLVPPKGYLTRLREVCDRQDILLILDEVITGMGRTGEWFASSNEEIVPDMLVIGKGLSAGYSPVAGVLIREKVVEAFREHSRVAPFGHTFSGNPLGAAVCLSVIDYIEKNCVLENVRSRGEQLKTGLLELEQKHSRMVAVRGRGLLLGFELSKNASRNGQLRLGATGASFADVCFREGLLVYPAGIAPRNNAVIVSPPLTISETEVELLIGLLDRALLKIESEDS